MQMRSREPQQPCADSSHPLQVRTQAITALDYGRVPDSSLLCTRFPIELILDNVKYCVLVTQCDRDMFALQLNGSVVYADTRPLSDGRLLVFYDSKTSAIFTEQDSAGLRLEIEGSRTVVFEAENDPSKLRASTTGKLVRFLLPDGAHLDANTPYAEMEVMKMYMQLRSSEAGVLRHTANPDSYVKAGDLIAELTLDDTSNVKTPEVFKGRFPTALPPHLPGARCHQQLRLAARRAEAVLSGFTDPALGPEEMPAVLVKDLVQTLCDPLLPFLEIHEAFCTVKAALPKEVISDVEQIIASEVETRFASPEVRPQNGTVFTPPLGDAAPLQASPPPPPPPSY